MAPLLQLNISGGDAKDKLFAQLFDIGRFGHERPHMILQIDNPGGGSVQASVLINGLTAEDGSGERWLITGYLKESSVHFISWLEPFRHFNGYYDARTRKGWLKAQD